MAQWWELAIPAVTTMVGTISAGLAGATLQRRSSERLLKLKAEDDERIRKEASDEAARIRQFELAKERQSQSYDARREAYHDYIFTSREIDRHEEQAESLRRQITQQEGKNPRESNRLRGELADALDSSVDSRRRLLKAYEAIMFLSPPQVISLAQVISQARRENAGPRAISSFETAFIIAANRDLNVAVREDF